MDELRQINLNNGTNIYAYSTPSVSRIHHNYPGMKIFNMNKNLSITNFTTYYTSHLNSWDAQQYQAINASNAIFPHCQHKTLSQCLNQLNTKQVCHYLDKGLFYGVKSPNVPIHQCNTTYRVNPN